MCWNGFAVMALDGSGVHTTGKENGDDKEMALGTHKDGDDVDAFFQVGLELGSTGSG